MARIYLVEDEPSLCDILVRHLEAAGYDVTAFQRGDLAMERLVEDPPDMAVLDIMVPGLDGLSLLRNLRERSNLPVIFISARKTEFDKVLGIELGADDYLVKPFSSRELIARIRALFRRVERERSPDIPEVSPRSLNSRRLVLDLDRRRLHSGASAIELTQFEFILMGKLMANASVIVQRSSLLAELAHDGKDSRAVDVHIKNLRRKLEQLGLRGGIIETVRGVGYRFED